MFNEMNIKKLLKNFNTELLTLQDKKDLIDLNIDFFKKNRDSEYLYLIQKNYIKENLTNKKSSVAIYTNKIKRYLSIHSGQPRSQIIFEIDKDNKILKDNITFLYNRKDEYIIGTTNNILIKKEHELNNIIFVPINKEKTSNRLSYFKINNNEIIGTFKDITFNINKENKIVQFKNVSKNSLFLNIKKQNDEFEVQQKNIENPRQTIKHHTLIEYTLKKSNTDVIEIKYCKANNEKIPLHGTYTRSDFHDVLSLTYDKKFFESKENENIFNKLINFLNNDYKDYDRKTLHEIYNFFEPKVQKIKKTLK